MPEGHTIHRLARGLRRTLGAEPLRASSPQGRFADGASLLDRERIVRADAWGKYLFVETTGSLILHVHLGLIGKFRPVPLPPPAPRPTIRLRLHNDGACWDLTGPTRCALVTPDERSAVVATLGPDPLRRNAHPGTIHARFAATAKPVGAVLLDQTVIAGLGNVYRAELLFLCGIDPHRPAREVSPDEVDHLWSEAVRLLRIGVRYGAIITTDPAEIGRSYGRMRPEDRLYVYHREHCRWCGTALVTSEVGGRAIQHCPVHQPA
jgi:endonuclease-8